MMSLPVDHVVSLEVATRKLMALEAEHAELTARAEVLRAETMEVAERLMDLELGELGKARDAVIACARAGQAVDAAR